MFAEQAQGPKLNSQNPWNKQGMGGYIGDTASQYASSLVKLLSPMCPWEVLSPKARFNTPEISLLTKAHTYLHTGTHTHTHTWAQYNKWRGRNVSIFIFKKMKNSFDLSFVWSNNISFLLPFSQHEWDTPVYALPFRELKCPKLENYQVLMLTLAEHEVTLNPLHLYSEVLLW